MTLLPLILYSYSRPEPLFDVSASRSLLNVRCLIAVVYTLPLHLYYYYNYYYNYCPIIAIV